MVPTLFFVTFASAYLILQYCSAKQPQHSFLEKTEPPEFIRTEHTLKSLIDAEEALYHVLKDAYRSNRWSDNGSNGLIIEAIRYFEDMEDNSGYNLHKQAAANCTEKYGRISGSPILCYRMIYRYIKHIPVIMNILMEIEGAGDLFHEFFSHIAEDGVVIPTQTDLDEASEDILRILHIYDLKIDEFAQGIIHGTDTGFTLQAKHCLEIGKFAYKTKTFLNLAVEWFEYTETLTGRPPGSFISRSALLQDLNLAIRLHDEEWERQPKYEEQFFISKINDPNEDSETEPIVESGLIRRLKRRTGLYEHFRGQVNGSSFNQINFWGLCSGDDLQKESEKSKLSCWYESKSNPAWYISPLKIELLSSSPYLIQIYEFLGDKLTEKLVKEVQLLPKLEKSKVYKVESTTGTRVSKRRTSSSKWVDDTLSESVSTLVSKRIEYLTGLSVIPSSSSEKLQIATYSFGRHYDSHYDYLGDLGKGQIEKGERIATVMIYLSGAELGGYTVFTEAQAVARPVKGSAVFWYNLNLHGAFATSTNHGACPVLIGNKLVANKWIRSNDQFLRRKCSLDPTE